MLEAASGAEEEAACAKLTELQLPARLMIDCGVGGAQVAPDAQTRAVSDVASRIAAGSTHVCGVLLASFLVSGQQSIVGGNGHLIRGQSITSACIDWGTTTDLLEALANAVKMR